MLNKPYKYGFQKGALYVEESMRKKDVHKQKQISFIQGLIHSFQQKWKSKLENAANNK
jgi:hypothetical protein